MPFGCRPHERGLTTPFACVVFRSAHEQRFHRVNTPRSGRHHEHGLAAGHRRIGVGAGIEQQLDDGGVAVRACERERRHAIAIRGVDARARFQQQRRGLGIFVIRGPMQCRRPVHLCRIDVDPALEQRADDGLVAVLGGIGKGRALGRRGGTGDGKHHESESNGSHAGLQQAAYNVSGLNNPSILPSLSPNESSRTPTRSSSVRCRFARGVPLSYLM